MGKEIGRQTATGIEQSLNASYAQTETYFIQHCDYLMPRVHQMRTDLAQYYNSTKPSLRLQYITSNDEKKNFEMNGTDLLMRDLNLFATTKANHRAVLEQLKQLSIQNNTSGASIYDLGNIIKSDSIAEVSHILKKSQEKTDSIRQEEQQHQQQMQEAQLQAMAQEKQKDREFQDMQLEKKIRADIMEAEIKASGYGAMQDINQNMQSDYLDSLDRIQQTEQYQQATDLQREKEFNRNIQHRDKMSLEQQKLATQKEIADKQLQIAQTNKNKYDVAQNAKTKDKEKKKS
jgi:hypothetical protein